MTDTTLLNKNKICTLSERCERRALCVRWTPSALGAYSCAVPAADAILAGAGRATGTCVPACVYYQWGTSAVKVEAECGALRICRPASFQTADETLSYKTSQQRTKSLQRCNWRELELRTSSVYGILKLLYASRWKSARFSARHSSLSASAM